MAKDSKTQIVMIRNMDSGLWHRLGVHCAERRINRGTAIGQALWLYLATARTQPERKEGN